MCAAHFIIIAFINIKQCLTCKNRDESSNLGLQLGEIMQKQEKE